MIMIMLTIFRLKDCDVTWLYGPLQPATDVHYRSPLSPVVSRLSKNDSFSVKKPILKKRSMSEIMLQRSISSSSLLKQAAAAIHSQQAEASTLSPRIRPAVGRAISDFSAYSFPSEAVSNLTTTEQPSSVSSSSGVDSPGDVVKRHIHFSDTVDQCIAVDIGADGDEEDVYDHREDEDSSDDGVVMMKASRKPKRRLSFGAGSRSNSFSGESKTIAMLPSTTLKYTEAPQASQSTSSLTDLWSKAKLSPSPSQETLRPSKPSVSSSFFDEADDEVDMAWEPSGSTNATPTSPMSPRRGSDGGNEEDGESSGLRRTASGMFMPIDDEEPPNGYLGSVLNTVNTARDIAHVIWNVGWRR
jgi:hypothetical protein